MGRMLESLKRGEGAGFIPRADKPHMTPATVIPETSADLEEDDVPYIEIGAPGRTIEASPDVLAQPSRVPSKPATPVAPTKVTSPLAAVLTEPKALHVAYEPWPRTSVAARQIAPEIIAFHQPEHPVSKQYAELLEKMVEGAGTDAAPVLLLCGSAAQVGTTTVLLNLAVCGSRAKSRVVVVDANAAHPALAQKLGIEAAAGWKEIVAGSATLEQAVLSLSQPPISVLSVGEGAFPPLKVEAVRWVLSWLRERFDLILIDGPDVNHSAALAVLAGNTDAVYVVVPDGDLPAGEVNTLTQPLTRHGGRVRGLVRTHYEGS